MFAIGLVPRGPWRQLERPRRVLSIGVPLQVQAIGPRRLLRLSCLPESVWQVGGAVTGERSPKG